MSRTLPAAVAQGDLIVFQLSLANATSSSFVSSGTATACASGALTRFDLTQGAGVSNVLFWGVAAAGDASKTCSVSWTGSGEASGIIAIYTTGNYYTTTPIDFGTSGSAGVTTSTSAGTYTSNSLQTFFYTEFLAVAMTEADLKTIGTPSPGSWTKRADQTNSSGNPKIDAAYFDGATRATAGSATVSGSIGNPARHRSLQPSGSGRPTRRRRHR